MKQFVLFILLFRGFKGESAAAVGAVVVYKQVYLPLYFFLQFSSPTNI